MKHRSLIILTLSVLGALSIVLPAHAQSSGAAMTDSHIQIIKQNCKAASRAIQQIHANDGPLRVNRGQAYDSISTKLMTPLNSRLIVNKLDASALVKTTAQYDKVLGEFRENYRKYDNQMSSVLGIDCVRQPVRFYDAVTTARQLRSVVHGNVAKLHDLIGDYGSSFTTFRAQFSSGQAKGEQ